MGVGDVVARIKDRLQDQQAIIGRVADDGTLSNIRAELDALWEAVEVLAQVLDGKDEVVVRDYFLESAGSGRVKRRLLKLPTLKLTQQESDD